MKHKMLWRLQYLGMIIMLTLYNVSIAHGAPTKVTGQSQNIDEYKLNSSKTNKAGNYSLSSNKILGNGIMLTQQPL